jgi:type III pantothenate kinase
MTLLIDIGNTALKWTMTDAAGAPGRVQTEHHRGTTDLAVRLGSAWRDVPRGAAAFGCSVAAGALRAAVEAAAHVRGISIEWLRSEPRYAGEFVLLNGYRNPTQLGADRWHGMLGACQRVPRRSFVLVAAGTATTIDCVEASDGQARFVGGCIAPGQRLMLEALANQTAGLPQADGAAVDFPDTTDDAITTGVRDAQAGLVERLVRRFGRRLGQIPAVLVSGGDAERIAARLQDSELVLSIEHNLVLAGLAVRVRALRPAIDP